MVSMTNGKTIGIIGLGTALPEKVMTNDDFTKFLDTTDEWIRTRTGIEERHILDTGEAGTDIAAIAAKRAIVDAGVDPKEIDVVIYCTFTPDHTVPPSAALLQAKAGLGNGMTFDVNGACTGFIYGLQIAYSQIAAGMAKKVMVVGCDCPSRVIDYKDRNTCVLFGDGAGAVVVSEKENGNGILGNHAGADSSGAYHIYQKIGASAHPLTPENVLDSDRFMKMNGREVFKFAVRIFNEAVLKALDDAGLTVADIDLFVPHQANKRIITAAMDKFGLPIEKVAMNINKVGNTSAASVPLALGAAREEGRLKDGDVCALVAFGAGLTYGATILKW
jgi:3-oxoacyl-[acyl-carrier-protein] synthase III